jgi:hypothetical protein
MEFGEYSDGGDDPVAHQWHFGGCILDASWKFPTTGGPVESARQSPAIQGPVAKVRALPENPAFEQPLFEIKSATSSMVPSTPCCTRRCPVPG